MPCPDESALLDFAQGRLSDSAAAAVESHLDGCPSCRALVAEAARDEATPSSADLTADPEPASAYTRLGRYLVLELVSAGGMGVVYSAFDPDLERKVALKILRPQTHGAETAAEAQGRLLREAQAMARLSHPNVLPVFDVGTMGEQVFVAMELVEGGTLGDWLASAPRHWKDVVDVFLEAGRGLAAAHAAGLVHRDFKPSNVLIGRDGRVRVTDFGLARATWTPEEPRQPGPAVGSGSSTAGTPAYMSPEQLSGTGADARSDQFSFCVALWEGLYGQRPFGGASPEEHAREVREGRTRPVPSSTRVPAWLHRVLVRGLRPAPEDRYPFFESLLQALARSQRGDRLLRWGAGATAALALAGFVAAIQLGQPRGGRCAAAGAELESAWTGEARAKVEAAFAGAGLARDFAVFDAALRRWIGDYRALASGLCSTPDVGRGRCLESAGGDLEALVAVLGQGPSVARGREALAALEVPTACLTALDADRRWPVLVPEVAQARRRLAEAEAMLLLGRREEAASVFEEPVPPGLEPRRLLGRARAMEAQSQGPFLDAVVAAEAAREPAVAARAWVGMLSVRSVLPVGELQRAAQHARALFAASGGEPAGEARLSLALARSLLLAGDPGGAAEALGAADVPAASPLVSAETLLVKVELAVARKASPEAIAGFAEAASARVGEVFGARSPRAAAMLFELGRTLRRAGLGADSRKALEAALQASDAGFGEGSRESAGIEAALAELEQATENPEQAARWARTARGHLAAQAGEAAAELAPLLVLEAEAQRARARCADAEPLFEKALELAPADPLGTVRVGLARCRLVAGRAADALALLGSLAEEDAGRPLARYVLGRALWDAGRDRPSARALVEAVAAELPRPAREEAERWLSERPQRR